MKSNLASLLCLAVLSIVLVGCADPAPPQILPNPPTDDDNAGDKPVTRIEFASFGKFRDKLKERGGRRGGEEPECTGPNCQRPLDLPPQAPPVAGLGVNPLAVAAAVTPLGLAFCGVLGLGSFLLVRKMQET